MPSRNSRQPVEGTDSILLQTRSIRPAGALSVRPADSSDKLRFADPTHELTFPQMEMVTCDLPGIPKVSSGKVREIFDLGEHFLIVSTDRISAFDCVMAEPISGKGRVLTQLSAFWFDKLDFVPNHLVHVCQDRFTPELEPFAEQLSFRSMVVEKAAPLPIECVVRGYLAGGGWKEYQETGAVNGIKLPPGLHLGEKLPEPIFTPSTKSRDGHDMPIDWKTCRSLIGDEYALQARNMSLELYEYGRAFAANRGILIADTKFEFGIRNDELILIDECLTPDSSRFWPADRYEPGISPPSFDKQFVRDYLNGLDWDKQPPPPALPPEVVANTSSKYQEAYEWLTGLRHP